MGDTAHYDEQNKKQRRSMPNLKRRVPMMTPFKQRKICSKLIVSGADDIQSFAKPYATNAPKVQHPHSDNKFSSDDGDDYVEMSF